MTTRGFINAWAYSILFILMVGLSSCSLGSQDLTHPRPPFETATALKVIDGDTIKVNFRDKKESIRMIGIDTPESKMNQKAYKDAKRTKNDIKVIVSQGKKATEHLKYLIPPDTKVYLEFDTEPRDRYGRLLAYVYLPDGSMVNELVVRNGYASLMTYPPNVKYVEKLKKAYEFARKNQKGLWAN